MPWDSTGSFPGAGVGDGNGSIDPNGETGDVGKTVPCRLCAMALSD